MVMASGLVMHQHRSFLALPPSTVESQTAEKRLFETVGNFSLAFFHFS